MRAFPKENFENYYFLEMDDNKRKEILTRLLKKGYKTARGATIEQYKYVDEYNVCIVVYCKKHNPKGEIYTSSIKWLGGAFKQLMSISDIKQIPNF